MMSLAGRTFAVLKIRSAFNRWVCAGRARIWIAALEIDPQLHADQIVVRSPSPRLEAFELPEGLPCDRNRDTVGDPCLRLQAQG